MIRRRHMGVGADHEAGPAVDEMAHRHLFRRGFGMEIDEDGVAFAAHGAGVELAADSGQRIVKHRLDHHPAHGRHDQDPAAGGRLDQGRAPAGAAGRPVDRPQQVGVALDKDEGLALVEGMIAEGDAVSTRRQIGRAHV